MHLFVFGVVAVTACGGGTGEEAEVTEDTLATRDSIAALRQARVDSVAMAEDIYDEAAFDSIVWRSDNERFERGEDVWSFSCSDCHGVEGRGDGPIATRYGYDVPDFQTADWEYADDIGAIRQRVFVGHESEMPTWGLYGLSYRDIDAVAYHVNEVFARR
jgi:mono/diheme cytochrome c family protein